MKGTQEYKNRQILQIIGNLFENLMQCLTCADTKVIIKEKLKLLFDMNVSFNTQEINPEDS